MLRRRVLIATTIAVLSVTGVAIARSVPDTSRDVETSGSPAPSETPTPTPDPTHDPVETARPQVDRTTYTERTSERHVIHGSGSIGVVSGHVDQGEHSGGAKLRYIGPSPRPSPSS